MSDRSRVVNSGPSAVDPGRYAWCTEARFGQAERLEAAYQYAEIYTQWGDVPNALEWLGTALRLRDSGLLDLKTDPLLDPLRQEPRFQAIERELKFPSGGAARRQSLCSVNNPKPPIVRHRIDDP